MASQKRIPLAFVLLPLVAVLGVVGVIGWTLYKDYAKSEAEDDEARRLLALAQDQKIRAARAQVAAQRGEPVANEDEDELGNLPGQPKKQPVKAAPVASLTPSQKAYAGFKSAYEKLENANENAARKFRARKLQLDDQYNDGKPKNEAKFVADCEAARTQILELLRNPENQ